MYAKTNKVYGDGSAKTRPNHEACSRNAPWAVWIKHSKEASSSSSFLTDEISVTSPHSGKTKVPCSGVFQGKPSRGLEETGLAGELAVHR